VPRLTGPNWPSFYRRIEPGDMLIVTRLDRLVRSTRDLLNVIAALADRVCHARGRSPEGQEAEGRPCRMIFRSRMQRLPLRYAVKTWPGSPAIFFTRLYLNHDVSSDWIKIEAFNLNCGGPFWSDHSDIAAAAPVARNSAAIPAKNTFLIAVLSHHQGKPSLRRSLRLPLLPGTAQRHRL